MTHQWHDSFRHQTTPAHHLDPRSKMLLALLYLGAVLLTPRLSRIQAFGYPCLLLGAAVLAGVRMRALFSRFLTILPFALLIGISAWLAHLPWIRMADVLGKGFCSVAAMSLLMLTTPFPDLLRALEQMRLPRFFVMLLAFFYRYADVLQQEAVQLERAWSARYFGRFRLRQWRYLGHILASLIVRSYERAENVFAAMQARGFSRGAGGMTLLHFGPRDVIFVTSGGLLLVLLRWVRW